MRRGWSARPAWQGPHRGHQGWVLAFWVGTPSTELETPLRSRFINTGRSPLALLIAQDRGWGLGCRAGEEGAMVSVPGEAQSKGQEGTPSSLRSSCPAAWRPDVLFSGLFPDASELEPP